MLSYPSFRKKQPVVFLPNSNDGKNCSPSGQMSSFGYLAFVLSLINAVVNAANNVNNNQVRTVLQGDQFTALKERRSFWKF